MRIMKVGVIGLGVGEQHIIGYQQSDYCEVVSVCDLNLGHANSVARNYGIPNVFDDWRKVIEDPQIDAVSICSYDDGHAEQCIAALKNGKHVMVEKPVALFRSELEDLVRTHQHSGLILTSNLILRRSPRFRQLRSKVLQKDFGEIFYVEGGYIHNILWKITEGWRGKLPFYSTIFGGGIHLIDLMRWVLGKEVLSVQGMSNKVATKDTPYRFDDTFITLLGFDDGVIGRCLSTFAPVHPKFHEFTIYGTRKTYINDIKSAHVYSTDDPASLALDHTPYPGVGKHEHIPDFVNAIRCGMEPDVTAQDVFRVMEICLAAEEATSLKKRIDMSYMT